MANGFITNSKEHDGVIAVWVTWFLATVLISTALDKWGAGATTPWFAASLGISSFLATWCRFHEVRLLATVANLCNAIWMTVLVTIWTTLQELSGTMELIMGIGQSPDIPTYQLIGPEVYGFVLLTVLTLFFQCSTIWGFWIWALGGSLLSIKTVFSLAFLSLVRQVIFMLALGVPDAQIILLFFFIVSSLFTSILLFDDIGRVGKWIVGGYSVVVSVGLSIGAATFFVRGFELDQKLEAKASEFGQAIEDAKPLGTEGSKIKDSWDVFKDASESLRSNGLDINDVDSAMRDAYQYLKKIAKDIDYSEPGQRKIKITDEYIESRDAFKDVAQKYYNLRFNVEQARDFSSGMPGRIRESILKE